MTEALLGFGAVFLLALLRVPLAFAMGFVGFIALGLMRGWGPTAASAAQVVYDTGFAYTLSVVPLFILMGNFVAKAGLAHELFRAAYAFIGHVRGGLAHATVLACAGFGAICGSSIATAATMSKVAYPSMKKLGYSDYLSTGVIAAGGTLGIMIPPSTILVIYGIVTETNIGKLFAAGIIPGLLTAGLLMAGVAWITWRDPNAWMVLLTIPVFFPIVTAHPPAQQQRVQDDGIDHHLGKVVLARAHPEEVQQAQQRDDVDRAVQACQRAAPSALMARLNEVAASGSISSSAACPPG
jgi:TRAP-type mannitol/chloroaromatic compound transport system permease large subunit